MEKKKQMVMKFGQMGSAGPHLGKNIFLNENVALSSLKQRREKTSSIYNWLFLFTNYNE